MRHDAAFVSLVSQVRHWLRPGQTELLGMVGLPGAGKSTLAAQLVEALSEVRAACVSLDDFYLPREERLARGFPDRGPPGTHDQELLAGFVAQLRARPCQVALPVFDRGTEQPLPPRLCKGPLDLCVLEGFLVGIDAPGYEPLRRALDHLIFVEMEPEAALAWRRHREATEVAAGRDYNDPDQEARFQMSGLDDLASENPRVRRALRTSYDHWFAPQLPPPPL